PVSLAGLRALHGLARRWVVFVPAGFVLHDPSSPDEPRGRDDYRSYVETYRAAFPDVRYEVEDVIVQDDRAALRYTASGTHEGEFMGIEPTGRRVELTGNVMHRLEDGRLVETWACFDMLGLFEQLGAIETTR
ncbi:MAG: ester cyclase, partial [Halalkalicoccus sp.]